MRLAPDHIDIVHGNLAVRLRPSLRAAYRLECRHGLMTIVTGINECHIGIIADIVAETCDDPIAARRLLMAKVGANGVRDLAHLAAPLFDLVAACYGVEHDEEHHAETRERAGKPFSLKQSLEELFGIAAGWLNWTADDALNATPAQIIAAHRGHVAKLHAIYGSGEEEQADQFDPADLPTDEEVKAGVAKLKAMTGAGKR